MAEEGKIELIIDNPTSGGADGRVASESTQEYPVNVIVDTREANHTIVKAALRCNSGFKTTGNTVVTFTGGTAARWQIADDDSYLDVEAAEEADYADSLILNSSIGDTNHLIWLKVSTDGAESAVVDTSVRINVYGRTVPAG